MQKIYVLLRNDRQTGPYSLEEIIQFDLKSYDLIWIQGQSAGWYYPQEIAALHPYLSFLPKKSQTVTEAKPPSTVPGISQKAETSTPPQPSSNYKPEAFTNKPAAAASTAALEEAVHAQFRKQPENVKTSINSNPVSPIKKKPVNSAVVGLTTILVVGGVFAASWILNRKDSIAAETPMELKANLPAPAELTGTADNPDGQNGSTPSSATPVRKNTTKGTNANKATTITSVPVSVVSTTSSSNEARKMAGNPGPVNEPPVIQNNEESSEDANAESRAPVEKKKKLRDKLFDIFRKKTVASGGQEETAPAENKPGERNASRRDESANLAQMVHIRFTVPNEWMMGIHGAKATLVNRSNETIQSATVEVQYFDEDDQILQKKIISFDKIGGKGTKTISIPDHPTATKVDYNVVSVSGKPAA